MTVEEQLEKWVAGESIHNPTRGECCPDFSCCDPALQWPEEKRKAFAAADQRTRNSMLMESVGALVKSRGLEKQVHIIGADD